MTSAFTVDISTAGGIENRTVYGGTVAGGYDGPTVWNGSGTIERNALVIHSGRVEATTVDQRRDSGQGIALDGIGNVYVVGRSEAGGFPITNAVQAKFGSGHNDAFVTRLMVTPPPPSIQTAFFGEEVVVSWLAVSSELVLETRELGGGAWAPVTQKPILAAGRYAVRLQSASAGRLFRLRASH